MQTKRFLFGLPIFCAALIFSTAWGQSSGSVNQAFQVARQAVNPDIQTKVVSVYGVGTPSMIEKWYIIFYDSSVPSHGRAVLVQNNQIVKTYPANGGMTYSADLTFDPSRLTSEGPALSAAQGYAAKHDITYDSVTALLKQAGTNRPFRWKIGLLSNHNVKGYVMVNAVDDTVAAYVSPNSSHKSSDSEGVGGFANDVKNTFLGIGGDLEEFFTGERTVDK
ncbi:MAG: hypothetical protein LV479_08875 [Methylacidiphilales bacterium]|nr:hypothetical protein [Candidatus Methylacidiphilales bacterium]